MKKQTTKKVLLATTAVATASALLLGGTLAWQNISQRAKNEQEAIANPGGRLHDDYNGKNKDIYVENFTKPGLGEPIYVRVRLHEYMEFGADAGKKGAAGHGARPLMPNTNIDDVNTWTPRIPTKAELEGNPDSDADFHKYWKWTFGGETTYMPTFNMNKDSLIADINGTFQGKNGEHYDDYIDYSAPENQTKSDYEIYDADSNDIDEGNGDAQVASGNISKSNAPVEHTVKKTRNAKVMLMADWLALPAEQQVGDIWVFDTDGWAYYAKPIMPGEATGLLLTGIELRQNPMEKWYYGLEAVSQIASAGEWDKQNDEDLEGFRSKKPGQVVSDNAKKVLNGAKNAIPSVTITADKSATTIAPGSTLQLTATVKVGSTVAESSPKKDVIWTMTSEKPKKEGTTLSATGLLTVDSTEEIGNVITIRATSKYNDAVYGEYTVKVVIPVDEIIVNTAPTAGKNEILPGNKQKFTYEAKFNGEPVGSQYNSVTWSMEGGSSSKGTSFDSSTVTLTVGANETPGTMITIIATSTVNKEVVGKIQIKVLSLKEAIIANEQSGAGDTNKTVMIDDVEFYVLKITNDNRALMMMKNGIGYHAYFNSDPNTEPGNNQWKGSSLQNYLNTTWLDTKPTVKRLAVQTTLHTQGEYDGSRGRLETKDKVFVLSEADVFGKTKDGGWGAYKVEALDYTLGVEETVVPQNLRTITSRDSWWLRSPSYDRWKVAVVYKGEPSYAASNSWDIDIRPTFIIDLNTLG